MNQPLESPPAATPESTGPVPPGAPATPPAAAAPVDAAPPPAVGGPSRPEVLARAAARHGAQGLRTGVRELSERRGLRTVLLGLALTLLALRLGGDSALSVPLLVVGLAMLVVGAMGPRLRGHVGLDFGPEGTAITVHTHVAPPGRRLAPDPDAAPVIQLPPRPRIALVPTATPPADGALTPDADVVESTGETVEIDVAQLRALLDAEAARDAS